MATCEILVMCVEKWLCEAMLLEYLRYMCCEIAFLNQMLILTKFDEMCSLMCSSVSMSRFGPNVRFMLRLCLDVSFLHLG